MSQKEKTKNKPTPRYRKWILGSVFLLTVGFIIFYTYGERVYDKLKRMELQVNIANQQVVAMQEDDLVLITFDFIGGSYTVVNLTENLDGYPRFPEWSSDGEWIAFDLGAMRDNGEDERSVYIMRADGSDRQRIAKGVSPQWHPHKPIVYFNLWDGRHTIRSYNMETGEFQDVVSALDCESIAGNQVSNYRLNDDATLALMQVAYHRVFLWDVETHTCTEIGAGKNPIWLEDRGIIGNSGQISAMYPLVYLDEHDFMTPSGDIHIQLLNGSSPSASPDGRYILYDATYDVSYIGHPSRWSIFLYDTRSGLVIPVLHKIAHATWRPAQS